MTFNIIHECCKLSQYSYLDPDKIKKKQSYKFTFIESNQNSFNDCQLYTFNVDNYFIICFRGTSSYRDLLSDVNILQSDFILPNLQKSDIYPKVHSGFYNQFLSICDRLNNIIKKNINGGIKKLVFCGHSLGGALSTLASLYFYYTYNFKFLELDIYNITFGSPRVGDQLFVSLFNDTHISSHRIVHESDPVPFLPDAINFAHIKSLEWITENTIKRNASKYIRYYRILYKVIYCQCNHIVKDHNCKQYLDDVSILYK